MRPPERGNSPATTLRIVLLPQPDGPSSATNSPCRTLNETLSTAVNSPPDEPNRLKRPSTAMRTGPATLGVSGATEDNGAEVTGVICISPAPRRESSCQRCPDISSAEYRCLCDTMVSRRDRRRPDRSARHRPRLPCQSLAWPSRRQG